MFRDPTAQIQLFSNLTQLSIMTATTAAVNTAAIMSDAFGAAAKAYGSEPKTASAKKTKPTSRSKKSKSIAAPAYVRPNISDDFVDLALAPMRTAIDVFSSVTPETKQTPTSTSPFPAWMGTTNPFEAFQPKQTAEPFSFFTPFEQFSKLSTPFSAAPMCAPFAPKSGFDALPNFFSMTAKSPIDPTPWLQMFGLKRERTALEKMTDPFDLGSNVVPFPQWAAKSSPSKVTDFLPSKGFEPAAMAAGMASMMMAPKFAQSLNGSSVWPFFAG